MRIALLGYGRIGRRHFANLREIDPVGEIVVVDHASHPTTEPGVRVVVDTSRAAVMSALDGADAAVIASPAPAHLETMLICGEAGVPFLVEKPPVALEHADRIEEAINAAEGLPCAVGFNYRFHPVVQALAIAPDCQERVYEFEAHDNLLGHYGPTVVETMASHAFDLALFLAGEAIKTSFRSDGVSLTGSIEHHGGARSIFAQRMDRGPRLSRISDRLLYPDDEMYLAELRAWLGWVRGGKHDPRTATLYDGVDVMDLMASVRMQEATL